MIPKKIHYCWFGNTAKNKTVEKCIKSWKRVCPDYEFNEWNENNIDIQKLPLYVKQAYEEKKWAFVTDYVRLMVVYQHGGIYLDTDVELIKSLDPLLSYSAYFGYEDGEYISTGIGFGAKKAHPILKELMNDYENIPFRLKNGSFDLTPCPVRNTEIFIKHGLKQDDSFQIIDDDVAIFPQEFFCPMNFGDINKNITSNTISVHLFEASWFTKAQRRKRIRIKSKTYLDLIIHIPNSIVRSMIGIDQYENLKNFLRQNIKD